MADGSRVLFITGASSGIGEALARAAVAQGDRVLLFARSEDRLVRLADELGGSDHAVVAAGDVTGWTDLQRAVGTALDAFGRIDVAVANAGLGVPRGFLDGDDEPEGWRDMVLVNVYGAALTARATLPHLRDTTGHLVLMGSVAGRVTIPGSLYSATKWAVSGMGHAIRAEVHGLGVRVTVVEPGKVDTPWFSSTPPDSLDVSAVTDAVFYALSQPPTVDVNEILLRPIDQTR